MILMVLWALCLVHLASHATAARFNVVGSQNEPQHIRLKAQYDIEPGKVLKLPIDVPEEYISLFGTLPPRLQSIDSNSADGVYGTGDIISVLLQYSIDVLVSGTPALTMNTGCSSSGTSSCLTKEVQSFSCRADRGKFAVRLEDQFLMNVDAHTTKEELKKLLQEFQGVGVVTVTYSDEDDRPYSQGNRVCTSLGNTVTVQFDEVSFPQYNGDVPMLTFTRNNTFSDLRGGLNIGQDDSFLTGVPPHSRKYTPYVTDAVEVVKGVRQREGTAYYASGSSTKTLLFNFIVQDGDFTDRLEVQSISFSGGYVYGPVTGANVSLAVPNFLSGPRYMSKTTSALGFHRHIQVTSAQPLVVSLSSPDADGTYTQGDVLRIYVLFDLPVKLQGSAFSLQLSTGAFDRVVAFTQQVSSTLLEFRYLVQEGDTSDSLDVTSELAFNLGGGNIFRDTSTNETLASTVLPTPGGVGSLSYNKKLQINTLSPQIVDVTASSREGYYTSGDLVDFTVTYGNPVNVQGVPRLLIENTPIATNTSIRTAPFTPTTSYTRAKPGAVCQLLLTLSINWDLEVGDSIVISLPGFFVRDATDGGDVTDRYVTDVTDATISTVNRTMTLGGVTLNSLAVPLTSLQAVWVGEKEVLVLTANYTLSGVLGVRVAGSAGLHSPLSGVASTGDAATETGMLIYTNTLIYTNMLIYANTLIYTTLNIH
ncbi:hypothetical protein B484DRAFT_200277 [Ochromonadaceae sp. CCMP2298]|nr:hypothetical protein B484DRAFT_200277 [Ochromonadaceae sp. CCMP2298]